MVAPVVILTLISTALGSWRRSAEATEVLGRRVRRGAGGNEYFVPGRRCRADAGRADAGIAGLLAEATALAETSGIAGALEAEIAGTADHVLDHAAQFLAVLAGVLDHHRLAEIAPLRDVSHVTTPQ